MRIAVMEADEVEINYTLNVAKLAERQWVFNFTEFNQLVIYRYSHEAIFNELQFLTVIIGIFHKQCPTFREGGKSKDV